MGWQGLKVEMVTGHLSWWSKSDFPIIVQEQASGPVYVHMCGGAVLGVELGVSNILGKHATCELYPSPLTAFKGSLQLT